MSEVRILLSLLTEENDFQRQQAAAAKEAAERARVNLSIVFAENDAINQSQQLLKAIQSSNGNRPDGVAFEGASPTAFPQVAKAAVAAGVGWAVVNSVPDYMQDLRTVAKTPVFAVSADQREAGRIQGRQLRAIAPGGGMALFIQGPSSSVVAQERTVGIAETKPENIQLRAMRGNWTQESAYEAVIAWLRLSTSHNLPVAAIVAQNDSMAIGVRKAFEESTSGAERERWLSLPFLGCDGLPQTGQAWVQRGLLSATIIQPTTAGLAIEMLAHALGTKTQPTAQTFSAPTSYPAIDRLGKPSGSLASLFQR